MSGQSPRRLPEPWGRFIDRDKVLEFEFDDRSYRGLVGDSLTSALAANGNLLLSRSFKYHRPRGSYTLAGLDSNAYVNIDQVPNSDADRAQVRDGMRASAQNVLGSLKYDLGAVLALFSRFLPVGFYYRSFFRPNGAWRFWEPLFRRVAGLGRISETIEADCQTDKQYLFSDVVVVGGGPAGLSAAIAAAKEGKTVLLVDEEPWLGGSLNYARFGHAAEEVDAIRDALLLEVSKHSRIRQLTGATCTGWFEQNWLSIVSEKRLYKVRADQVILATGSVEQPAVFRNNDLPGVMLASAAQRLLRLYGVRPGCKAVVITANAEGYDVAQDLDDAGVEVSAIIDIGTRGQDERAEVLDKGIDVFSDRVPVAAIPSRGNRGIRGLVIAPLERPEDRRVISADLIVTSVGYAPLGQLACHDGGRLTYDETVHAFRVSGCPKNGQLAGSVNHIYELERVLDDGAIAGRAAASGDISTRIHAPDESAEAVNHPYPIFPHPKGKEFVDFDEDQTVGDLVNAVADGFSHPELAKRYSTVGMGPSQGRLSATNALRIVAYANNASPGSFASTTQRPPYRPERFELLAGCSFQVERLTPMHDWHLDHRAEWLLAGVWRRPAWYQDSGDRDTDIAAEVRAVREAVGLIDVSTLGCIDVRGREAAAFLDRLYTFNYAKQPVGRTRYVLMTDDSGSIIDDGVACRLSEQHFYVTTTTTGSDAVVREMLHRAAEWNLDVSITNLTSAFAAINIAGPRSRDVLQRLESDIDFSKQAFPYLAAKQGQIAGVNVLAMRIGFVGELGFEIHIPSSQAKSVWEQLYAAGAQDCIRPVGIEAQRILRLEKGHIIVGQDTDGLTHPAEAGLDWAISDKKHFVGKPAIGVLSQQSGLRKLVGFRLDAPKDVCPEECNLVIDGDSIIGRVTSVAVSAAIGAVIGLAYVPESYAAPGSKINIKLSDTKQIVAAVCTLPFYDPHGSRQEH